MGRSAWTLLQLLPVLGLCLGALDEAWLPGTYVDTTPDALRFLSDYNSTAEQVLFYSVSASWNYNTNLTEHNSNLQVRDDPGPGLHLPPTAGTRSSPLGSVAASAGTSAAPMHACLCRAEPCLTWRSLPLFISLQLYMHSQLSLCVTGNVKQTRRPTARASTSSE